MQPQVSCFYAIDFLDGQHPFLVKPGCRSRKGKRYHQAKQGENRALDGTKTGPLTFRLFRTAPGTKTAAGFQQPHADEKKLSKKQWGNRGFQGRAPFANPPQGLDSSCS